MGTEGSCSNFCPSYRFWDRSSLCKPACQTIYYPLSSGASIRVEYDINADIQHFVIFHHTGHEPNLQRRRRPISDEPHRNPISHHFLVYISMVRSFHCHLHYRASEEKTIGRSSREVTRKKVPHFHQGMWLKTLGIGDDRLLGHFLLLYVRLLLHLSRSGTILQ